MLNLAREVKGSLGACIKRSWDSLFTCTSVAGEYQEKKASIKLNPRRACAARVTVVIDNRDYVTGIGNYVIIASHDHYGSEAGGEYSLGSENASSQLSTHIVHTFVAIWSGNVHSD